MSAVVKVQSLMVPLLVKCESEHDLPTDAQKFWQDTPGLPFIQRFYNWVFVAPVNLHCCRRSISGLVRPLESMYFLYSLSISVTPARSSRLM